MSLSTSFLIWSTLFLPCSFSMNTTTDHSLHGAPQEQLHQSPNQQRPPEPQEVAGQGSSYDEPMTDSSSNENIPRDATAKSQIPTRQKCPTEKILETIGKVGREKVTQAFKKIIITVYDRHKDGLNFMQELSKEFKKSLLELFGRQMVSEDFYKSMLSYSYKDYKNLVLRAYYREQKSSDNFSQELFAHRHSIEICRLRKWIKEKAMMQRQKKAILAYEIAWHTTHYRYKNGLNFIQKFNKEFTKRLLNIFDVQMVSEIIYKKIYSFINEEHKKRLLAIYRRKMNADDFSLKLFAHHSKIPIDLFLEWIKSQNQQRPTSSQEPQPVETDLIGMVIGVPAHTSHIY